MGVAIILVTPATTPATQEAALAVTLAGRATQPGEVVRVDVTCECGSDAVRATAFDRDVPLTPSPDRTRWQGLIGIDVDVTPGTYPLVVEVPEHRPVLVRTTPLRVLGKRFATRTLRVAPEFVDPPPDVLTRMLAEASMLDALFKTTTPRGWEGPFGLPVKGRATGNFGSRSVFNGEPRSPHAGVDFRSPTGTSVSAPAAGRVVFAGDLFFTGNTVIVDHGAGLYSLFAHLSSMAVGVSEAVVRGTVLGRVGATGRVTGPHLHWSVRLNAARVNPLSLVVATDERKSPPIAAAE